MLDPDLAENSDLQSLHLERPFPIFSKKCRTAAVLGRALDETEVVVLVSALSVSSCDEDNQLGGLSNERARGIGIGRVVAMLYPSLSSLTVLSGMVSLVGSSLSMSTMSAVLCGWSVYRVSDGVCGQRARVGAGVVRTLTI